MKNINLAIIIVLSLFLAGSVEAQKITKIEKENSEALAEKEVSAKNLQVPAAPESSTGNLKTFDKPESADTEKSKSSLSSKEFLDSDFQPKNPVVNQAKQTNGYVRPTSKQRFNRYLSNAFGVPALISTGFGATINQITNDPPECERSVEGFGKRLASKYGENVIRQTVSYGISEAFKLDNTYEKSASKNFGKRLRHTFVASYTTRTKSGKRIPDFPQFIGTYTGSITAAEVWFPDRYSYKDGLREGTISLGVRFGVNLLREFILK